MKAAAPEPLPECTETTVVARMQEICTIIDVFVFKMQLALKAIVFEDSDSTPHPPTHVPRGLVICGINDSYLSPPPKTLVRRQDAVHDERSVILY